MNIRDEIKKDLVEVIGKVGKWDGGSDKVEVQRPADPKNGDYSTNAAMKFSREFKQSPMEFAKFLADSLKGQSYIEKLEVKEPGFLNFFVKDSVWQNEVEKVLKAGDKFGSNVLNQGKKARVEFVSANPTGPLHFGNARGGPIGDVLASVLEFSGYKVVREYYHNDLGGQIRQLGSTIAYKLNYFDQAQETTQDRAERELAYKGSYVDDLAKEIRKYVDDHGGEDLYVMKSSEQIEDLCGSLAVKILLKQILEDCREIGIKFDDVYSESGLIDSGKTAKAVNQLEIKGFLKKKEGAVWFAPSDEFLKDRETVVKKSDGNFTYFANDIAYHDLKFKVDPDLVIDVFGANHHGHVPRLQAVIKALGYDVSRFHVILYQWVRFKRGGELVKMSKRAGTFVTAREVLDEIGRDALRFFILMHDANSPIDFDLDLAKEKSAKNPVYYVQYAHARICAIFAKTGPVNSFPPASARSGNKSKRDQSDSADLRAVGNLSTVATRFELLNTDFEVNLIKQITKLPELVEDISKNFAVNQLTTYAISLADSFHKFYENCKVVGEKKELEEARIWLITATKIALENTLGLLGISAPEKM